VKNSSPVVPSSSKALKDLPSVANRWLSSESSRENRENGQSLATNQPTVGLRFRSLRHRRLRHRPFILSRPVSSGWPRSLKRGGRVFLFSFFLFFFLSFPPALSLFLSRFTLRRSQSRRSVAFDEGCKYRSRTSKFKEPEPETVSSDFYRIRRAPISNSRINRIVSYSLRGGIEELT